MYYIIWYTNCVVTSLFKYNQLQVLWTGQCLSNLPSIFPTLYILGYFIVAGGFFPATKVKKNVTLALANVIIMLYERLYNRTELAGFRERWAVRYCVLLSQWVPGGRVRLTRFGQVAILINIKSTLKKFTWKLNNYSSCGLLCVRDWYLICI